MAAFDSGVHCAWLSIPLRRFAGEIEQGFLLAELAQHHRGGLKRGQLAISRENVELAVVLPEAAPVSAALCRLWFVKALAFADGDGFRRWWKAGCDRP